MGTELNSPRESSRRRRRISSGIRESLRELSVQLSLLNHQVSGLVELRHVDLDCYDVIARTGPISPSALARRAGLHPATVTGILDRLETGGWISRERDSGDRRAVRVRDRRERTAELLGHYAGMNDAMDAIYSHYSERELAVIADFVGRAAEAGRKATEELAAGPAGRTD